MTVRELIVLLEKEDQDRLVVLSIDQEGNGYYPMNSLWTGKYENGEVGIEVLTAGDIKQGYTEEDVMTRGRKAIIFS